MIIDGNENKYHREIIFETELVIRNQTGKLMSPGECIGQESAVATG